MLSVTTLVVSLGAYTWTRDRRRSFDLQESDQARRAGAILGWTQDPGDPLLKATVINASELPIRVLSPAQPSGG